MLLLSFSFFFFFFAFLLLVGGFVLLSSLFIKERSSSTDLVSEMGWGTVLLVGERVPSTLPSSLLDERGSGREKEVEVNVAVEVEVEEVEGAGSRSGELGEGVREGRIEPFWIVRAWTRGLYSPAALPNEEGVAARFPFVFRIHRFRSLSRIVGGGTSSSGPKSYIMLKIRRISSGVFPFNNCAIA